MYIKNKTIIAQRFKTLKVEKLVKTDTMDILGTDLQDKAVYGAYVAERCSIGRVGS